MTTVEALKAAKAKLEKPDGWVQDVFDNGKGGYCAIGSLQAVCPGRTLETLNDCKCTERKFVLAKAIGTANLAEWNDNPKRTKAEVLAAFDKAIKLAQKEAKK